MKNGRINECNTGSIKNDGGVKKGRKQSVAEELKIYARVCISGLLKTGVYENAVESWTFYDVLDCIEFLRNFSGNVLSPEDIKNIPVIGYSIAKRADEFEVFHIVKVQC